MQIVQQKFICFIDYSKAFDCVEHKTLWQIILEMGFPKHLVCLIENLYMNQEAAVRVEGETSEWFDVGKGVRQGCILSPYLFNIYAENIISQNLGTQMILSYYHQPQKVLKK